MQPYNPMAPFGPQISSSFNLEAPSFLNGGNTGGFSSLGGYGLGSAPGASGPSFMDMLLGKEGVPGLGQMGLQALGGIGSAYMGMKQYGLAKNALKQSRDQFNKNFGAQQKTLNTAMEDRQRARLASNPNAHESVDSYMEKNRI